MILFLKVIMNNKDAIMFEILQKIGYFVGSIFFISLIWTIIQLIRWMFGSDVIIVYDLAVTIICFVIMSIVSLILTIMVKRNRRRWGE